MRQPSPVRGSRNLKKLPHGNSASNGVKKEPVEVGISHPKKTSVRSEFDPETMIQYPPVFPTAGSPVPLHPSTPQTQQFDRKVLIAALRRRWFLATTLGIIVAAIAAGATYQLLPEAPYTAFAELHVKSKPEIILFDTVEADSDFNTYKQTQMRLVISPFVLAAALRNPEVGNLSSVTAESYPIQWLEKEVKVTNPASEFIRIALSGDHAEELHKLVSAISTAYMEEVVNSDLAKRNEKKSQLETIFREMEDRMQKKKAAVKRLAEALNTGDSEALTLKQQLAVEYYGQLRKEHTQVRFDLMRLRIQMEARKSSAVNETQIEIPDAVVDARIARDPEIQKLYNDHAVAEELVRQTQDRVKGDDHKLLVQVRERLTRSQTNLDLAREKLRPTITEELNQSLHAQSEFSEKGLEREIELLTAEEKQLASELESQKLESRQIGISSFELESLNKEVAQMDAVAVAVSEEIEKLNIELQTQARIKLHRPSEVPTQRDLSFKNKLTALAALGGFGLVVGGLVWLEVLIHRISSTHQVVDGLGLRILGSLPIMPSWMRNGTSAKTADNKQKAKRAVISSVWTESIDAARTVLLRDASQESKNSVMIASAVSGEGKTTMSCHLAISFARGARRTLLIDMDLRRPSVHKVFNIPLGPGFCDLLRGDAEIDDVIQQIESQEGLFVIPAGKINQATLRALAQNAQGAIIEKLKTMFDFLIIDSAPILPVNDSLLIAQNVDSVLFSIRRDISCYGKVQSAYQRLSMLGVPVVGAVVTGLDETSYGYYRYASRYSYGYGYGAQGYNTPSPDMVQK